MTAQTPAALHPARAEILRVARSWIGTPYRHQASLKGAGCDCLGLIRGVWREIAGAEPEAPPPYSRSWAEDTGQETMRDAARRHLREVKPDAFEPGDVLIFRVRKRRPAKHAAIAVDRLHIIQAYEGHAVEETPIPEDWRDRIAYAFAFPWVPPPEESAPSARAADRAADAAVLAGSARQASNGPAASAEGNV